MTATQPVEIEGVEGKLPPSVGEDIDVLRHRRWIGYSLGGFGILSVAGILVFSICTLDAIDSPPAGGETFTYVRMGVHALIFVAWVWFSYQILRAAERLIIPYWWLRQNLEAVKVMLGLSDPWRAALKASEEVLELGGKAAQSASKVVSSVASAVGTAKKS